MNISALFIKRPVMTTLVMLAILVAGFMGYGLLPVSDLPNVDFPTISVSASLPGASPETMASSVATVLEKEFSTIAGIDSMSSVSTQGSASITLQFSLDRDIDAAAQDVQSALAKSSRRMPSEMTSQPSYRKVNPADQPILYLVLSSPVLPLSFVDEYAQSFIAQRISMISGVAQVQVFGSQKRAVRIRIDPAELISRGVGIDELASAIRTGNVNMPSGSLDSAHRTFTLETNAQLTKADEYKPLIIAYKNGSPVRVGDVADVIDSVENSKSLSWYITRDTSARAIILAVQKQPGTNTVKTVDSIVKLLPTFRAQMPAAINLDVLFDGSKSIRASVEDVKFTLVLTICLVVLVIFLFLRSFSATMIPSFALPMSLIGTFAVMYLMKFNLDNMSLMALTLSVGFVVDDAIVMLENIVRHKEMGKGKMEAALEGSKEVSFTILSMTLSLAAVFIPVLFMGGIIGRILNEFAITISAAILISGIVSLTLTPMLCSRFLWHSSKDKHGFFYNAAEKFFDTLFLFYKWTLTRALRLRKTMMMILVILLGITYYLFGHIPKGFLPSDDSARLAISTEGIQGISFEDLKRHQEALNDVLRKEPQVEAFMSRVSEENSGRMFVRLTPRPPREISADELVQQLRAKMSGEPGIKTYIQNPPMIRIGGQSSKSQYQYSLQSPDTKELYKYAQILEDAMRELPGFLEVTSDLQLNNPKIDIEIDRDKASTLGITANQIEDALYTSYGTREISTFYTPNNSYKVILELDPKFQKSLSVFSSLYIRSSSKKLIPFDTIATIKQTAGPLAVNHIGQLPAVTVSFSLKPGIAIGDAVKEVNKLVAELMPKSITGGFQGTAQAFESSFKGMGVLLILSILVIYIVLGILYESFLHPITILSGLPSAGVGALLTLWIFKIDLNIYAFVGIIMLVGIVKKNAIMMIDFALDAQRKENKTPEEAIFQGCLTRFRPIMMTTMAALMGGIPIAIGFGAGSDARRPLGLAIVGGLILSQLLTLYITPVFYIYMEKIRNFRKKKPEIQ